MIAAPHRPQTIDELAQTIAAINATGEACALVGGSTEIGLGNPAVRPLQPIATSGLGRIIEYAPSDQTITVEAGVTYAALQAEVRKNGQFLAIDAAHDDATIGGLVAANTWGRRRTKYGTIKDLIVGVGIVRADGTRARGGGKVVKNVAGFDLPKLMVGSLGTLGAIVETTFRLHPLPQVERAVGFYCNDHASIQAIVGELIGRALEPTSVEVLDEQNPSLLVRFDGFERGVAEQIDATLAIARAYGVTIDELDATAIGLADIAQVRARTGAIRLQIAHVPSAYAAVMNGIVRPLLSSLDQVRAVASPTVSSVFVSALGATPETRGAILEARAKIEAQGGTLVMHAQPSDLQIEAWGTPPPAFALMRALKERFDPRGTFNPGRFVGGL
jgi:glycolate oxidase FAD binding subunit